MNKEFIKKILGKKGTDLARSIKNILQQEKLTIQKYDKSFNVMGNNRYSFWKIFQDGEWEPQTFEIFKNFLDKNHSYIDIGAWIGPTALYGCQLSKLCYAIEPDPIAYAELRKNLKLNQNLISQISLSNLCISDSIGTTKLFTNLDKLYAGGTSGSTILERGSGFFWTVETTTFLKFIQSFYITDCNFIKMDIEGAEFKILPTMLEFLQIQKPTLLIEFHPMYVKNYSEELNYIRSVFDCYEHIYNENLINIDMNNLLNIGTSKTFRVVLSNKTV